MPPSLCGKNLLAGWTEVLNIHQFTRIDYHQVENELDIITESISDNKIWLDWNPNLDNPIDGNDNWEGDNGFELELDNCIEDPETPVQRNMSTAPKVPRLIGPTQRSMKKGKQLLMMVNTMERRRNIGNKT